MAEKKYLDYVGLSHYDEKIKKVIEDGDTATLTAANEYTDSKIGSLGEGVATVAAAIAAEKGLREQADSDINDAIGTDTTEGTIKGRIKALEDAIGEEGSVAKQIADAIDELDSEDTAVAHQFVTAVSEEDGVITVSRAALTADDIPDLTLEKITDAGTAAAKDVATVAIGAEGEVTGALVTSAQVKAYVDGLDGDMDERVENLEATHAKTEAGVYMTVAAEADAAVAKIVADAPEAFDTLKEIADWIQKEGEQGFDAAARIVALEDKTAGLVVETGKEETVANAIDKAVSDEADRVDDIIGDDDTTDTVKGRIKALEDAAAGADTFVAITNDEIDKLFETTTETTT